METDIIFLDTSIFENENFFKGQKLIKIAELSKTDIIKVKITEITLREVRSRMHQNLTKASLSIKKAENLMDNEARILKNLGEYGAYYPIKKFNLEDVYTALCKRFDDFLVENKIEIIGLEDTSVSDVFDKYFKFQKPFGEGKKKSEFPDAFTLDIITKWCEKHSNKAYVIAIDGDIVDYECEKGLVITKGNLAEFLELLVKKEKGVILFKLLQTEIKDSLPEVIKNFESTTYFEDLPYELNQQLMASSQFDDVDAYNFTITNSEIKDSHIIYLDEDGVIASELMLELDILLPIDYYDYEGAWYDNEDDVWYGRRRIETNLESTIKLRIECEYHFTFDDDLKVLNDFDVYEIQEVELEEFDYDDGDDYY